MSEETGLNVTNSTGLRPQEEKIMNTEWISCKDSLPQVGKLVLVTDGENMWIAFRSEDGRWDDGDYLDNIEDIFVTTKDYLRNLSARGVKKSEILQNSTLMLLDKGNMTRKYIDDYLQENQIHVKDSIDISNMDLLIDFAKIGVGVACVIKSIVSKELADGTLIEIPLGIPIHKREVGFAYKESSKLSTSLQTFIKFYESYTPEDF